jgi:hypothetical protein
MREHEGDHFAGLFFVMDILGGLFGQRFNKIPDRGLKSFFSLHGISPSRFLLGVVTLKREQATCQADMGLTEEVGRAKAQRKSVGILEGSPPAGEPAV